MVEEESSRVVGRFEVKNDKPVAVTEKDVMNLISFSKEHGHSMLHTHLTECITKTPIGKVLVHKNFRRDYTNPRSATSFRAIEEDELPQAKRLRSSMSSFNWKENCMLCGEKANIDPQRNKIHNVTTFSIHDNLLECCDKRDDAWASEVQKRLCGCLDLVAAEAIYHGNCYLRFKGIIYQQNVLQVDPRIQV